MAGETSEELWNTGHSSEHIVVALWRLVVFASGICLVPAWLIAWLLLVIAGTTGARLAALAVLFGIPGCIAALAIVFVDARRRFLVGAILLVFASLFCTTRSYWLAPEGLEPPGASLHSFYLGPPQFRRFSLANLVPEIDQFKLASYLVPLVDPYIDLEQSSRIRGLFLDVYSELRRDPAFVAVGSNMNWSYRQLLGMTWDKQHCYLYLPSTPVAQVQNGGPHADGLLTGATTSRPVLLFLHGWGGNPKAYMWVLKDFADRTGCAVFAPDFGIGAWDDPAGIAVVRRTLEYIRRHPELDARRVVLAGLSNGGMGVTRAGIGLAGSFRALFYISAVIEPSMMARLASSISPGEIPVWAIHGEMDRRIPRHWVVSSLEALEERAIPTTLVEVGGEDHFLFFSQREMVVAEMEKAWPW